MRRSVHGPLKPSPSPGPTPPPGRHFPHLLRHCRRGQCRASAMTAASPPPSRQCPPEWIGHPSHAPLDTAVPTFPSSFAVLARSKNTAEPRRHGLELTRPVSSPRAAVLSTGIAVVDNVATNKELDRKPLYTAQLRRFSVLLRRSSPSNSSPSAATNLPTATVCLPVSSSSAANRPCPLPRTVAAPTINAVARRRGEGRRRCLLTSPAATSDVAPTWP